MNDSLEPQTGVGQQDARDISSKADTARSSSGSSPLLDSNEAAGRLALATAATLASMGYLYSIALAVAAGVVAVLGAALGTLFALVFENELIAVVFILLGGIASIALLVASIAALLRADVDKNRARGNQTGSNTEPLRAGISQERSQDRMFDL